MVLLGEDRSHWNAEPDFAAFKRGGRSFVFCKGTDGTSFKDPTFEACRIGTKGAGLVFGAYHFAQWGNVAAEAAYFLSQCKPQPSELIALDAEANIPAGVDVVGWVLSWCRIVHAATGCWPFVYENSSWLAGHNWAPVVAQGDGLWLAKYDGLPTGGATGPWPFLAMKQFTDRATMPGQSGAIDEDAFNGSLAALLRYAVPTPPAPVPPPPPPPPPIPPGDFMAALNEDQQVEVYNIIRLVGTQVLGQTYLTDGKWGWPTADGKSTTVVDMLRGLYPPGPPVAIDAASAQLIADALAANPAFQETVATAARAVVTEMDADLANRFGPKS